MLGINQHKTPSNSYGPGQEKPLTKEEEQTRIEENKIREEQGAKCRL